MNEDARAGSARAVGTRLGVLDAGHDDEAPVLAGRNGRQGRGAQAVQIGFGAFCGQPQLLGGEHDVGTTETFLSRTEFVRELVRIGRQRMEAGEHHQADQS